MCTIQYTLYNIHYTIYTIQYTLYNIVYTVQHVGDSPFYAFYGQTNLKTNAYPGP